MVTEELVVGRCYRLTTRSGATDWLFYLGIEPKTGWTCWLRRDGTAVVVTEEITGQNLGVEPPPERWLTLDLDLDTQRQREYWLIWALERSLGTASATLRERHDG